MNKETLQDFLAKIPPDKAKTKFVRNSSNTDFLNRGLGGGLGLSNGEIFKTFSSIATHYLQNAPFMSIVMLCTIVL